VHKNIEDLIKQYVSLIESKNCLEQKHKSDLMSLETLKSMLVSITKRIISYIYFFCVTLKDLEQILVKELTFKITQLLNTII